MAPVVIISIHLRGMRDTVGSSCYEALQSWLEDDLIFFTIDFDLDLGLGIDEFTEALESMQSTLEKQYFECVNFYWSSI
jgi:hypothetical protein